ncbi:MAG: hypothetical protein AMXMBFR84_09540 [Candidatus Hydrogenedentota bacterium]
MAYGLDESNGNGKKCPSEAGIFCNALSESTGSVLEPCGKGWRREPPQGFGLRRLPPKEGWLYEPW